MIASLALFLPFLWHVAVDMTLTTVIFYQRLVGHSQTEHP